MMCSLLTLRVKWPMWMREALGEARLRGLSERERRAAALALAPGRRPLRRDDRELDEDDELEREPEEPELELDEEREREVVRELLVLADSLLKLEGFLVEVVFW